MNAIDTIWNNYRAELAKLRLAYSRNLMTAEAFAIWKDCAKQNALRALHAANA